VDRHLRRARAYAEGFPEEIKELLKANRGEFGLILSGLERWCKIRPRPSDWLDFAGIVTREFASS
jgi:hypothetical protein